MIIQELQFIMYFKRRKSDVGSISAWKRPWTASFMWIKEECEGVSARKRDTKKKWARKETRRAKGSTLELQDKITCTYLDRLSTKIITSRLEIHTYEHCIEDTLSHFRGRMFLAYCKSYLCTAEIPSPGQILATLHHTQSIHYSL